MKRREMTRIEMMREIRECWREVPEGSYIEKVYEAVFDVLKQEPCEDAISRDDAIRIAEQGQIQGFEWEIRKLVTLPSVNPQQKTGEWITWKEAGNQIPSETRFECSVCHDAAQTLCNGLDLLSNYCPNCGARMTESEG